MKNPDSGKSGSAKDKVNTKTNKVMQQKIAKLKKDLEAKLKRPQQ